MPSSGVVLTDKYMVGAEVRGGGKKELGLKLNLF
jgi:hypothetical protein